MILMCMSVSCSLCLPFFLFTASTQPFPIIAQAGFDWI